MMRALFRTPWPTLSLGLALSVLGVAAIYAFPDATRGVAEWPAAIVIFGGLALMTISLALQEATDSHDGIRRWKAGLRWLISWSFLHWAFSANWLLSPFESLLGGPGTPSRIVFALVGLILNLAVPIYLAGYLAEALRRAAAWLGDESVEIAASPRPRP